MLQKADFSPKQAFIFMLLRENSFTDIARGGVSPK